MRTESDLLVRASTADEGDLIEITPESAGWAFTGLRVIRARAGIAVTLETGELEYAIVPVSGGALLVTVDGEEFSVRGRGSVFETVPDVVYAPREASVEIVAVDDAVVALPNCPARVRREPALIRAEDVAVEVRGSGRSTRQVTNFLTPDVDIADRLLCCEVLTPRGNWSSYPPHKHDDASNGAAEAELEEIYWFQLSGGPDGWGFHRTYDLEDGWDVSAPVRSGDAFLVPTGYHGPCVAPPEFDMWYLNVLAGPGEVRSMAISDDPAFAWIRGSWAGQTDDPRVPMTSAPNVPGSGR
jgi:5-deoxy-glucuronate isomerase